MEYEFPEEKLKVSDLLIEAINECEIFKLSSISKEFVEFDIDEDIYLDIPSGVFDKSVAIKTTGSGKKIRILHDDWIASFTLINFCQYGVFSYKTKVSGEDEDYGELKTFISPSRWFAVENEMPYKQAIGMLLSSKYWDDKGNTAFTFFKIVPNRISEMREVIRLGHSFDKLKKLAIDALDDEPFFGRNDDVEDLYYTIHDSSSYQDLWIKINEYEDLEIKEELSSPE